MENGKVRNLTGSSLKVISRAEQPAAKASTSDPPKPRLLDQVRQAIRTRHLSASFWDALILAAAQKEGAGTLWSEDLNHGQNYDGVTVRNPFVR